MKREIKDMKKAIAVTAIALGMSMNANAGPLEQSVAIDATCAGVVNAYSQSIPAAARRPWDTFATALEVSAVSKAQRWLGLSADNAIRTINRQVVKTSQTTIAEFNATNPDIEAGERYMHNRMKMCYSAIEDAAIMSGTTVNAVLAL